LPAKTRISGQEVANSFVNHKVNEDDPRLAGANPAPFLDSAPMIQVNRGGDVAPLSR
jgi:hypothetical protein